ncbi:MAG TPA: PEP/pyruvate-binding domain-containing protein, partial [Anaerolineae bacterium]|nr:PEP/pyruvate-binding domain-containing protein [Anaerolineae bacterium]
MAELVRTFDELTVPEQALAGGKGGTLARLYQAGYPVPEGFVILPAAFTGDKLTPEAWTQVQASLKRMRQRQNGIAAFAVRSSALSEDSAQASFAGEFETVLDVHTDEMIRASIQTVRQSRWSERVRAYSEAKGIDAGHPDEGHDLAVIVQHLVRANISGVLFTANPVSGSHLYMTGNFVFGFGEELVSGEAEPYTFSLTRPKGQYKGPPELGRFARKLFKLALRLEEELDGPQDIEWAIADRKLFVLQSRPITTLVGYNPATGEWNDSLTGDYLWSNTNLSEAVPEVMTPLTWSFWRVFPGETAFYKGNAPLAGNICGRPYGNASLAFSLYTAMGKDPKDAFREMEGTIGRIAEGVEIPLVPMSRLRFLLDSVPAIVKRLRKARAVLKEMPEYVSATPAWCRGIREQIQQTTTQADLIELWRETLEPYYYRSCWMLRVSGRLSLDLTPKVRDELAELVGEVDANALLLHMGHNADLGSVSGFLASLGPAMGVAKVARGEMSREDYLERFGHRGPEECELSAPRPYEDRDWLD